MHSAIEATEDLDIVDLIFEENTPQFGHLLDVEFPQSQDLQVGLFFYCLLT